MIKKISSFIICAFILALLSACGEGYSLSAVNGCYLDKVEGGSEIAPQQFAAKESSNVSFLGWVIDPFSKQTISKVKVIALNDLGKPYLIGDGRSGFPRSDVAAAFNNQGYANAGYKIDAKLNIPKGSYKLQFNSEGDSNLIVCAPQATLVIN